MKIRLLVLLLTLPILGLQDAQDRVPREADQMPPPSIRFEPMHVFIDSGDLPLAAYQLVIEAPAKSMRIVGIEGGAHAAFAEPPYYDPKAMQQERVVIADFSLASAEHLPRGRTRIATIHVLISGGDQPHLTTTLKVAATVDGQNIMADIEVIPGADS